MTGLQQYARQFGRPISADQARALGLDRLVITQLISDVALDERARALGLNVSDAEVVKRITTDPAFLGPNGQFDRFRFEQTIRQAGYTEARFISEQRRQMLRRQLATTIVSGSVVTQGDDRGRQPLSERAAGDRICAARPQQGRRDRAADAGSSWPKYFDDRKMLFRAPEYRKLHHRVADPLRAGAVDRNLGRRRQSRL